MKVLKIVIGTYILLNSISLYAESTNECMKYWSENLLHLSRFWERWNVKIFGSMEK